MLLMFFDSFSVVIYWVNVQKKETLHEIDELFCYYWHFPLCHRDKKAKIVTAATRLTSCT